MITFNTKYIGQTAEHYARSFLEMQGLHFLQKNYQCCFGEIDLIMKDRDDIVFVEVRYRQQVDYGHPLESISKSKIKRLIKTGMYFLKQKKWLYTQNSRFDVVTIHTQMQLETCEWIKNVFSVEEYGFF